MNNLLARGAAAWSSIAESDRAQWAAVAMTIHAVDRGGRRRHVHPFQLFVAAYIRQAGLPNPTDPVPPDCLDRADPISIVTRTFQGALVCNEFSRDLGPTESALIRVLRQCPHHWRRPIHHRHATTLTAADEGLGIIPDLSIYTNLATTYAYRSTVDLSLEVHTLEFWIYPLTPQPQERSLVFNYASPGIYLDWYRAGNTRIVHSGATYLVAATPAPGRWYYICLVVNNTAHTITIYKNGVLWHSPWTLSALTHAENFRISGSLSNTWPFYGFHDDWRFSNIARTPPEMLAIYNNGIPKQMPIDDDTICLLRCNELAPGSPHPTAPSWFNFSAFHPHGAGPPATHHPPPGLDPSKHLHKIIGGPPGDIDPDDPQSTPLTDSPGDDLLLDSTDNHFDFNGYNLTLDAGVHSRVLYAAADRILPSPCAVWTQTQALDPSKLTALSTGLKSTW